MPGLVLCDGLEGWDGGGEGDPGTRACMYNYGWFALMCGRNQHNIIKLKIQKKNSKEKKKGKKGHSDRAPSRHPAGVRVYEFIYGTVC